MTTTKTQKINFIVNNDNFEDFVSKLKDLTKISDTLKFKIDKDNILIYSLVGEVAILAFKNYTLDIKEYMNYKEEFDYTIDFIVTNAKSFVKKLGFFSGDNPIKMSMSLKDDTNNDSVKNCRSFIISDGELKINQIGGESYKIRDINKSQLETLLSPEKSEWSFTISTHSLSKIKKLSTIEPLERIIDIYVKNNKVHFSEGVRWDLCVGETEGIEHAEITFAKKYLGSINEDDNITFSIFETFILFNDKNSNLMVSFEQTFDEDE